MVLVLDNDPVHTSKANHQGARYEALAKDRVLPRYAPELNDLSVKLEGRLSSTAGAT